MKNAVVKGFFVTGTDTDIGKTYISRRLADCYSENRKVTYMKPVQTGCFADENGTLIAPDFQYIFSGKAIMTGSLSQHVPYSFEPACSPHLAARLEKKEISFEHISNCLHQISTNDTLTIVEGAGGILAPLSETTFMVDLILHLQLPVIVVCSLHLGSLNHTFLTLKFLRHTGAEIAGIVLNNSRDIPEDFIYKDNLQTIINHTRPVPILEVKHGDDSDTDINEFCKQLEKYI